MTGRAWTTGDVTLSTKCWEGDYRFVLSPEGLAALMDPFGPAARRQVVVNRVQDRQHAESLADALLDLGLVHHVAFAEDHWPRVAEALDIPEAWFGAAWPFSAPELVEIEQCTTPLIAHVAGDVGVQPGSPWLPRALEGLQAVPHTSVVSPMSPSGREAQAGRTAPGGWAVSQEFSDQCFVAVRDFLLSPALVRATHWSNGDYPKPGGALTFEARVAAWLKAQGQVRLTDLGRRYVHPLHGAEGSSYVVAPSGWRGAVPQPGDAYPAAGSVEATGLIIVRNGERTIEAAVRSLAWCRRVLVVDQDSDDATAALARGAGAEVTQSRVTGIVEPARREAVAQIGRGWVVMLDADEMVPARLAHRLRDVLTRDAGYSGIRLARKNMLLGRWASAAGWWPDPQLRVFEASSVAMPAKVHGPIALAEDARCLDLVAEAQRDPELALLHFNYDGYADWFERMNRYTTLQAREVTLQRARPFRQFVRVLLQRFVRQGGWRLGRFGWDISVLGALYEWLLIKKAAEYTRGGTTAVQAVYEEMAHEVLRGPKRGHPNDPPYPNEPRRG